MSAFAEFQNRYRRASNADDFQSQRLYDEAWDVAIDELEARGNSYEDEDIARLALDKLGS